MEPARLPTNLDSGEDRHRNFIIATTNESQGKFFPKAELVWGGGIADDGDDDDGETSFICHRAVKRSSRPRSLGSRSRRLKSAASANQSLLQATAAR